MCNIVSGSYKCNEKKKQSLWIETGEDMAEGGLGMLSYGGDIYIKDVNKGAYWSEKFRLARFLRPRILLWNFLVNY